VVSYGVCRVSHMRVEKFSSQRENGGKRSPFLLLHLLFLMVECWAWAFLNICFVFYLKIDPNFLFLGGKSTNSNINAIKWNLMILKM